MMPDFRHILLPVDFSEKNDAALDIAKKMAVQYDSRITLLHVIEKVELPDDEELRAFYDDLEKRASNEMGLMTNRFSETDIQVDRSVLFGRREEEIVRFSEERNVDLIVMSSHKIDRSKGVRSWNTVSYHVSLLCSCPVLLVK